VALLKEDTTIVTGNYYDKVDKLRATTVHKALDIMPKPAIHHFHLTAAAPIKFLVDTLCYEDFVYFSEKDQNIKVTHKPEKVPEGYIKMNDLRKFWKSAEDFDKYITESILLIKGTET